MAKRIRVKKSDGTTDEYRSTITKGYHVREAKDGICVTEKRLFENERVVKCYPRRGVSDTDQDRCGFCEEVNPTQQSD